MAVVISCEGCGKQLRASETLIGKLVRCPGCGQSVKVRDSSASVPPSPPTKPPPPVASYSPAPMPPHIPAAPTGRQYGPPPAQPYGSPPGPPPSFPPMRERPRQSSSKMLWTIVAIVGGSLALIAVVIGIVVASSSNNVEGKIFAGHETLMGFGALQFEFHRNHKVVMIDAGQEAPPPPGAGRRPFPVQLGGQRRVDGDWQQNGKKVICNFKDCRYEGTIENDTYSGSAQFTDGMQRGQAWTFTISFKGQRVR